MLAHRDQENLVHGHQQAAASKPLNQSLRGAPPKTPGNKYPKTPLKISLQDENGPAGFGGARSVLGTRGKGNENLIIGGKKGAIDKNAFVTPVGPRNRAPLGMKTTNAKAKAAQTPAVSINNKIAEKTQNNPNSVRRPKPKISHAETVKLDIHGDDSPLKEREVEYCPPKPTDLPYESDDFPEGCLDYEMLKEPNLMKGWQAHYHNQVDENGFTREENYFEAQLAKSLRDTDERVMKAIEDADWTVGDVPEIRLQKSKEIDIQPKPTPQVLLKNSLASHKGPATIVSRQAVSSLSVLSSAAPVTAKPSKAAVMAKPPFLARAKPLVLPASANASEMRHTAAAAASKSTIGYRKGRTASSVLNTGSTKPRVLARSVSNLSSSSDTTITPDNYAQKHEEGSEQWRRLKLLGAFDTDDENLEPGLRGELPDCLQMNGDEEEFVMSLGTL